MANTNSTTAATATASQPTGYFLRPGRNEGDPMFAAFELRGIKCAMLVEPDGSIHIHKVNAKGELLEKPIAIGQFKRNDLGLSKNAPALVGHIRTSKQTSFELAAWLHDADKSDSYYVVRYSERPQRRGQFFKPEQFAA